MAVNRTTKGTSAVGSVVLANGVKLFSGSGAPVNGTTGAGKAGPGSLYHRTATGAVYANTNTKASPTWTQLGSVAALASAHIFVGDGGGAAADVAMSGDVTIDNTGATAIGAGKVLAAMLGTFAEDGLGALKCARATFDPSATAGMRTVAAHGLGVSIPNKGIVIGGFVDVVTTCADGVADAATIALSVEGAGDIVAAIAIADVSNPWDAGRHAIVPVLATPSTYIKATAAREITATVAVHALTAGKLVVYLFYVQGS